MQLFGKHKTNTEDTSHAIVQPSFGSLQRSCLQHQILRVFMKNCKRDFQIYSYIVLKQHIETNLFYVTSHGMRLSILFSIYITSQIAYFASSYKAYIKHTIHNMSAY